jgi:hypothetical protein
MSAERIVHVGVFPQEMVIGLNEQVTWISDAANLRIEFDPKRCPFSSNVLQAPPGVRLQSGPPVAGIRPGAYKYRVFLNDVSISTAEILVRER